MLMGLWSRSSIFLLTPVQTKLVKTGEEWMGVEVMESLTYTVEDAGSGTVKVDGK